MCHKKLHNIQQILQKVGADSRKRPRKVLVTVVLQYNIHRVSLHCKK